MATTATVISVEEYLKTSFPDGDREYVDGSIVETNMGDIDHADLQTRIVQYFGVRYPDFWSGTAVRTQVKARRFRVPDVVLVAGPKPEGRIIRTAPFLVIEIVSPDDRVDELEEKIDDYLAFGVAYVLVVNPRTRRSYVHTTEGVRELKDGVLRTENPLIELPLAEMFR